MLCIYRAYFVRNVLINHLFIYFRKMRYVTSYVTLVLRLLLPVCLTVYYTWLRNQRTIVNGFRRQLVPAILAAIANSISLSTGE